MRLQLHVTGDACQCRRYRCFEKITADERMDIVRKFNLIKSWNDQTAYLTGLISLCPVAQRRPRLPEDESVLRTSTFYYNVRIVRDNVAVEERVCKNAFVSLHGLTRGRIETIQKSLQMKNTLTVSRLEQATSLNKTKIIYLSAELNVKKMYDMFKEKFPQVNASYETYRSIFCSKFNISFGYPRSDTCSFCDQLKVQIDACQEEKGIKDLMFQQKLHLAKAEVCYARKKQARLRSRTKADTEAKCMDFGRNLPMPNLSTNDVYYGRQLSLFSFIVHKLSNSEVFFYAYRERVGKKGANEVCSFLFDYITLKLPAEVRNSQIFCDSCSGQNKNFPVFKFLHYLIHHRSKLESIEVTFPIRGHSYIECDKDMGILNGKFRAEVPDDWCKNIETACLKPAPFLVEKVDEKMFFCHTSNPAIKNYQGTSSLSFSSRYLQWSLELVSNCTSKKKENHWSAAARRSVLPPTSRNF
ncbi:uncharacterized protein LOC126741889 [Anthonomus grandis grandis]|uniref:uncharacterized protein LOC126741889 n=1 Tax=Anthonomus grandis grandis TaxID=2921223 RepID=UPI0021669830|nr:uncharacterized protein LOC126741889 [Anthonomus grandis grandis]